MRNQNIKPLWILPNTHSQKRYPVGESQHPSTIRLICRGAAGYKAQWALLKVRTAAWGGCMGAGWPKWWQLLHAGACWISGGWRLPKVDEASSWGCRWTKERTVASCGWALVSRQSTKFLFNPSNVLRKGLACIVAVIRNNDSLLNWKSFTQAKALPEVSTTSTTRTSHLMLANVCPSKELIIMQSDWINGVWSKLRMANLPHTSAS